MFTALLLLCATLASAHDFEVDGIFYKINRTDNTAYVTYKGNSYSEYSGEYSGNVVIPESVKYSSRVYNVTGIDEYAFYNCIQLTSVAIGHNVTSVGKRAFDACFNLANVEIGNSVTDIGDYAFSNCTRLTSIEIGSSVTNIGYGTFSGCSSLASIKIPASVTRIYNLTFSGCTSLKDLRIEDGNTVLSLVTYGSAADGKGFFNDCPLETLYLGRDIKYDSSSSYGYSPFNGKYRLTSVTIGDCVTNIGKMMFQGCLYLTNLKIGNSVTSIADYAFNECSGLRSIELPASVKSIGEWAFRCCSGLTELEIPEGVTSIGDKAFYDCFNLTGVISNIHAEGLFALSSYVFSGVDKNACILYVPYGAKATYAATSGWNAFTNIVEQAVGGSCGTDVNWALADGVLTITGSGEMDDYTWESTAPWSVYVNLIESVVIEDGVTTIGEYAFKGYSGLKSIEIPNSVTRIGLWAFYNCDNLTEVEIPNSVTILESGVFAYCENLVNVVIPNSVTSIGVLSSGMEGPFEGCKSLREIKIPNSVTVIGDCAFNFCTALESVEIPSSVTSIGYCAFGNCTALKSVTSLVPADELFEAYAFDGLDFDACTLYVPYGAEATYASTNDWKNFKKIFGLSPEEITITIDQYGSGTYCSEYALDFSNVVGLKAYAATGYNSKTGVVTLTRLQTAMEGTGLFLIGEPGEYTVPVIEYSNDYTLNLLVGTLEKTTVNGTTDDGNYVNLKYTVKDNTPMFYQFEDGSSLSANKAYLQLPAALFPSNASKSVNLRFDDGETTDIEDVDVEDADVEIVYDLQGRAVENPTKGVYIVNGKKVFINK